MITYARISSSRKNNFSIISKVEIINDKKVFVKSPYNKESEAFVSSLLEKYEYIKSFKDLPFIPIKPVKNQKNIQFDFLKGRTYKAIIEKMMKEEKYDQIIEIFRSYKENILDKLPNAEPDIKNKDFIEIFAGELDQEKDFILPGVLDLNLDNFILTDTDIYLIDYEWAWDFPIPKEYLFFRSITNVLYDLSGKGYDVSSLYSHYLKYIKLNYIRAEYNFQIYVSENPFDYLPYYKSCFEVLGQKPASFSVFDTMQHLYNHLENYKTSLNNLRKTNSELEIIKDNFDELLNSKRFKLAVDLSNIQSKLKNIYYKINHKTHLSKLIYKLLNKENKVYTEYDLWINKNENYDLNLVRKNIDNFHNKPLISVVIPVYNVELQYLKEAIQSVKSQYYDNWEICLVDDNSSKIETRSYINSLDDKKIHKKLLETNVGIAQASNIGINIANGDYIAFLDHDDTISPFALYEVVKVINEKKKLHFIYSDEDKLSVDGKNRFSPLFKPDWSEETLFSTMYPAHLRVFSQEILKQVGAHKDGYDGSQDYDLVLRVEENINKEEIAHIPKILYHWRTIPGSTAADYDVKPYARNSSKNALESAIKRRGLDAKIIDGLAPHLFRLKYNIKENPLVSIIIPVKDNVGYIKKCIESIENNTDYKNYEIIIIDNNSENTETIKYFQEIHKKYSVISYSGEFNYSAINNSATKYAKGEHLLFLNSDTEVISPDWLSSMIEYSQQKEIGAVGAKLLFSDNLVQHAGVVLGIKGIAGHSHRFLPGDSAGYMDRLRSIHNVSAVTGACLMIKKSLFDKVGKFNEDLTVAFNDIDLCLKLLSLGYRNVVTPYALLYHHESKTRGVDDTEDKIIRYKRECDYMENTWGQLLLNDPYYSPNLTLDKEDFSIRV